MMKVSSNNPEGCSSSDTAKQLALKYVAVRMRTKQEVIAYLKKKGCDKTQVQDAIAFLTEYQYLDDAAYCKAWIHDKLQFHPCGRQKLAMELSKKISDRQLVQLSLEEYYSAEQELENAQKAVEQKLNSSFGRKQVTREQLARFLYSRGYSGAIIEQVMYTIDFSVCTEDI